MYKLKWYDKILARMSYIYNINLRLKILLGIIEDLKRLEEKQHKKKIDELIKR